MKTCIQERRKKLKRDVQKLEKFETAIRARFQPYCVGGSRLETELWNSDIFNRKGSCWLHTRESGPGSSKDQVELPHLRPCLIPFECGASKTV